eukprot:gene16485-10922_t
MVLRLVPLLAASAAAALTPSEHDAERQRLIDATNAKQDEWTAHHNARFRGAPVGVSKSLCGMLPGEDERIAAA